MSKRIGTKVITDEVRLSYLHAFAPASVGDSDQKKYSACALIPKTAKKTLKLIEEAIAEATEEGKTKKWGGKIPKKLHNPLRDGDEEEDKGEEYKGMYFINASSTKKPTLLNVDRSEIFDEEELKSGDWGKLSINFFPYSAQGNNGVGVGLNHIMKTRTGDALGGVRASAEEDFDGEFVDIDEEAAALLD